jgi:hypothetical protein
MKKTPKVPKKNSLLKQVGQVDQNFFKFLRERKGIDLKELGKDKTGFSKREAGLISQYYLDYLMSVDYD